MGEVEVYILCEVVFFYWCGIYYKFNVFVIYFFIIEIGDERIGWRRYMSEKDLIVWVYIVVCEVNVDFFFE